MRLSVTIITRDEEHNLPAALASCEGLADEIVIVDTGSSDGTLAIAAAHPAVRLLERRFEGFGAAKQAALDAAGGDWVLALDADERVTPALATKICELDENGLLRGMGGFRIRRETRVLGRVMTSMGLDRDYPLRLFRRQGASWNGRRVHEGVVLPPRSAIGRLEEPLEHHTFPGIDAYLGKIDLYTSLELQDEIGRKLSAAHLLLSPPTTFLRQYVGRGGYRDGVPGLLWASLSALGRFLKDVKLWIAEVEGPGALGWDAERGAAGRDRGGGSGDPDSEGGGGSVPGSGDPGGGDPRSSSVSGSDGDAAAKPPDAGPQS